MPSTLKPPVGPNTPLGTGRVFYNVQSDFGARGDGTTDDTAAIQAAIAALPTNGGTIYFPSGNYLFSSSLNFDSKRSVILSGAGGVSAGATQASVLTFSGTGSGTAVSARSTFGFAMKEVTLAHSSASFTGKLLDLSNVSGDTAYFSLTRCFFGGQRTSTLVSLNKAISGGFTDCVFSAGAPAVKGKNTAGDYSNAITFTRCAFVQSLDSTVSVRNYGQGWGFFGCTFEMNYSAGGSPTSAGALAYDTGISGAGLALQGCWFGDGNTSGIWVDWAGSGLDVSGCFFATGATAINTKSSALGVSVHGNQFSTTGNGVVLGNNNVFTITGNEFSAMTGIGVDMTTGCKGVVLGNTFTNSTAVGIRVADALTQLMIQGNALAGATTAITYLGSLPAASLLQKGAAAQLLHTSFMTNAGVISDASWPATPADGTIGVDTTNSKIYVRIGGTWKSVTVA